jgi:hypothetical protein
LLVERTCDQPGAQRFSRSITITRPASGGWDHCPSDAGACRRSMGPSRPQVQTRPATLPRGVPVPSWRFYYDIA